MVVCFSGVIVELVDMDGWFKCRALAIVDLVASLMLSIDRSEVSSSVFRIYAMKCHVQKIMVILIILQDNDLQHVRYAALCYATLTMLLQRVRVGMKQLRVASDVENTKQNMNSRGVFSIVFLLGES